MNTTQRMNVRKASAGSGKTYTLAAHYIALLLQNESFQSILAVTFTNKATAEMKDRILDYLYAIGYCTTDKDTQNFLKRVREITEELGYNSQKLTDDYCSNRAKEQHAQILSHYDEMRVQTIDTFLQSLLAGMVQSLGDATGYQVELDVKRVISDAVDDLLTKGAQDETICKALTNYMDECLSQEKNWDVRKGLNKIGEELYKELIQQHHTELVFEEKQLQALRDKVNWSTVAAAEIADLKKELDVISTLAETDFGTKGKDYLGTIAKIQNSLEGKGDKDKIFSGFNKNCLKEIADLSTFKKNYHGSSDAETVRKALEAISNLAPKLRDAYLKDTYRTLYMNDMILMGALKDRINAHLAETNTRLLATTANTLAETLKEGDADFVLEKAGIRYKHIMLDEFQDTSSLQWTNFEKLIKEILSTQQGSTLIVGDIKQSIYRWRNGDWTIMRDLQKNWTRYYNTDTPQLTCNFRSQKNVVQFNLETMQKLTEEEADDIKDLYDEGYDGTNLKKFHHPAHDGGYVRVRCYTQTGDTHKVQLQKKVKTNILKDMFITIEQLLKKKVKPKDIMILLRTNSEAKLLMDTLRELLNDKDCAGKFDKLEKTEFVSSNCFQLNSSPLVNLIVAAIRYIYTDDKVALNYVQQYAPDTNWEERICSLKAMALTNLTELVIEECILATNTTIQDLSYVNCFRDMLLSFVANRGSDGIAFLRYWDDTMSSKTIPAVDVQGIRLMTIHAAKGLEAENVFIPFCDWEMGEDKKGSILWCHEPQLLNSNNTPALIPVPQDSTTSNAGFANEYDTEHHLMRVDNLNVLYVALTRAAGRLFVYAPVTKTFDIKKNKNENKISSSKPWEKWDVGQLMAERCGMWKQLTDKFLNEQIGGENDFVEFNMGDENWMAAEKSDEKEGPLSFKKATTVPSNCHSSISHIVFRQSQDSRNYGWDIASTDIEKQLLEQRALGTICHDILSSIRLYPSADSVIQAVESAVNRAYQSGIIPSEDIHNQILPLLKATVSSLSEYFTGDWLVQCEETFLFQNDKDEMEERRMDRVMWSKDKKQAIVLDYKFGQDNSKYDKQVRNYMDICRKMGAESVRGFLWIAAESRLEEVK